MSVLNKNISQYYGFLGILSILLFLLPQILFWEDSYLPITDNLDSNVVWYKILSNYPFLTSGSQQVFEIMNAQRISLPTDLSVFFIFHKLFNTYTAIVILEIILRFIAFFGMYYFSNYILNIVNPLINIGVALSFAFLPFWHSGGIGIAGMPLLFYLLFNNTSKYNVLKWSYFIVYPFFSLFFLSGIHLLLLLGLINLYFVFKTKKINYSILLPTAIISILYIVCEFRMFQFITNPYFITHRTGFIKSKSFSYCLDLFQDSLLHGQWHAASFHYLGILPVLIISILLFIFFKPEIDAKLVKILVISLLLVFFISIFHGFYNFEYFVTIKRFLPILNQVQFYRFYIFYPIIWNILFVISLTILYKILPNRVGQWTLLVVISYNLFMSFKYSNGGQTLRNSLIADEDVITFQEYYASTLFNSLKLKIPFNNLDVDKIVCFGFDPAIAQYNGINTADGYLSFYNIEYHKKFKIILDNELQNNAEISDYFNNWGSRCYIFDDEIGKDYLCFKKRQASTKMLSLDFEKLKSDDVNYLISAVELNETLGLELIEEFESEIWSLKLYKLT